MDIDAAVTYLNNNAESAPTHHCARYVREALVAGGVDLSHPPLYAKDYGRALLVSGFTALDEKTYTPQKGDIVVIQNYPAGTTADNKPYLAGDIAGHIAMFNGTDWVSDFTQRDFWGGPGYRAAKPAHVFYRAQ